MFQDGIKHSFDLLCRVILALGFRFLLLSGGGGWGVGVGFIALFVFYNKDNKKLILFIYI